MELIPLSWVIPFSPELTPLFWGNNILFPELAPLFWGNNFFFPELAPLVLCTGSRTLF